MVLFSLRSFQKRPNKKIKFLEQGNTIIRLFFTLNLILLVSMMSACGSSKPSASLPDWVMNTPLGCGLGSLQINGSLSLAKSGAIAKGRADLARQIQTRIENVIKTYRSEGGGQQDFSEELMTQVSQQSSRALLQGTKEKKSHIEPSQPSIYYVLVCYEAEQKTSLIQSLSIIPKRHRKSIQVRAESAFAELESLMKNDY